MSPGTLVWCAAISEGLVTDALVGWFAILGGTAGFVSLAITVARGRAAAAAVATKPVPSAASVPPPVRLEPRTERSAPPPAAAVDAIPAEVMALISATVAITLGRDARIAAVMPVAAPSVELLQQWSIEGRRQIYSSHQIR